jgi:hypothetical protein
LYQQKTTEYDTLRQLNNSLLKTEGFKPVFEEKESINFLDLTVIRKKEKLEIETCRKPTKSRTPVHFTSNHPTERKLATY